MSGSDYDVITAVVCEFYAHEIRWCVKGFTTMEICEQTLIPLLYAFVVLKYSRYEKYLLFLPSFTARLAFVDVFSGYFRRCQKFHILNENHHFLLFQEGRVRRYRETKD